MFIKVMNIMKGDTPPPLWRKSRVDRGMSPIEDEGDTKNGCDRNK